MKEFKGPTLGSVKMTDQEEKRQALGQYCLALIRKGEIVSDPVINVICDDDGITQVVRGDFLPLVSTEAMESTLEIFYLGYKVCPECQAEMEQYITKEETFGIIWNWICPKCKYMDPKGWFDEKPKGGKDGQKNTQ